MATLLPVFSKSHDSIPRFSLDKEKEGDGKVAENNGERSRLVSGRIMCDKRTSVELII